MSGAFLYTALNICILLYIKNPFIVTIIAFFICISSLKKFPKSKWKIVGMIFCTCIYLWIPVEKNEPIDFEGRISEIKTSYTIVQLQTQKVLVYGLENVNYGDTVKFEGIYAEIDGIHNFNQFYFKEYMNRKNIYYSIQVEKFEILEEGKSIQHYFFNKTNAIDNEEINSWLKETLFQIHKKEESSTIISSSGLHLSFLFFSLKKLLILRMKDKNAHIFCIIGITLGGICFGFQPSIYRILCFQIVNLFCTEQNVYDRLGISILLTLILMPNIIYELSFIVPVSYRLLGLFKKKKLTKFESTLIVCIPIQFIFYNKCDFIQLALFPFLRTMYAFNYLFACIYMLTSFSYLYGIANGVVNVCQLIETFQLNIFYHPNIVWIMIWIKTAIKYITFVKIKMYRFIILTIYACISPYLNPFGEVLMFDIGQGDCILLSLPHNKGNVLIDVAGNTYKDNAKDVIVPVLKSKGIHRLDKVIVTHDDFDHSGGVEQLIDIFPVEEVIYDKTPYIALGDTRLAVLTYKYNEEDANDNSIVIYFETNKLSFLFMGDASIKIEKRIMEDYPLLEADVLKVGHHGSNTSSSIDFLQQIHPKLALISCGRNNLYHHPSKEVVENIQQIGAYICDTSKQGAVSIKFNNNLNFFRTADKEFGIINYGGKE